MGLLMISILLALHGIPVKSESQCDPFEYQNCQGECIDLLQIKPNISIPWLCGDQCQTFSKPCSGKCPDELYLTCNQTCALQSSATTNDSWHCNDACQPTSEPCNGNCLEPFHKCQNKCIDRQKRCDLKCPNDRYLDCSGKCKDEETANLQRQWICGNECQNLTVPCLGECVSNSHICNGKCIALEEPCDSSCYLGRYLGCDGKCYFANEQSQWMCNSTCQSINKTCNGECATGTYLCGQDCVNYNKPCFNSCSEGMIPNCSGNCAYQENYVSRWLCGNVCQSIDIPCNGSCPSIWNLNEGYICRGTNICFSLRHAWKCHFELRSNNILHDSISPSDINNFNRFEGV